MALVWVPSSQALTIPSGLPELLVACISDIGHLGAVEHQGDIVLLVSFIGWRGASMTLLYVNEDAEC
jgi:hypothetical protein